MKQQQQNKQATTTKKLNLAHEVCKLQERQIMAAHLFYS